MPKQGEIVLIPVPFTDLTSSKRRPVIVVSNDDYNQTTADIIVVAMTSTAVTSPYSFTITYVPSQHGDRKLVANRSAR